MNEDSGTESKVEKKPMRVRARRMAREAGRLWQVWLATIVLLVSIWITNPQQIEVIAYKATFITLGGLVAYWVDRWTFPSIRDTKPGDRSQAMMRRAMLMCAAMLAFAIGV